MTDRQTDDEGERKSERAKLTGDQRKHRDRSTGWEMEGGGGVGVWVSQGTMESVVSVRGVCVYSWVNLHLGHVTGINCPLIALPLRKTHFFLS